MKVQHTPIIITPIASTGGPELGFNATCTMWHREQKDLKVVVCQYGKTKLEALQRVRLFLGQGAEEVG